MIEATEFARRRMQLIQHMSAHALAIIPAASVTYRNADAEFPFRQHSDFYYLTGFEEPDAIMVLLPKHQGGEFILFSRPRDREEEIWAGKRIGQEGAIAHYLADQAFPIETFEQKLPALLEGRDEIHYTLGINKYFDTLLMKTINTLRGKIRNGSQPPLSFIDVADNVHEMRLIKSPAEIDLMRDAASISAKAHIRAMQFCKPGLYEYQLEAEMIHEFQHHGARFPAYTSIVGGGANACILHYNTNRDLIQNGDLVLIDAGCEYQCYASDITRTFPANGRFSAEQRAVYEIVLEAQLAGIDTIHPGASWPEAQTVIVEIITRGLMDLGLLKGNYNDLIAKKAYLPFYMHKSGHWLGLDVHDVGRYKINNDWRALQPGMILTVEPGIYIPSDIPNVPKQWHDIGIRIEDDLLVTAAGNEILSHEAPKSIHDIETVMARD